MPKIMSLEELKNLRDSVKKQVDLREKGNDIDNMIVIRVAMATCGIAAGARETMNYFAEAISKENIENVVLTQSGCMGYCYAEPTVEITMPGEDSIVYGHVDKEKAQEILEKYIKGGETIDGLISTNHSSIEE